MKKRDIIRDSTFIINSKNKANSLFIFVFVGLSAQTLYSEWSDLVGAFYFSKTKNKKSKETVGLKSNKEKMNTFLYIRSRENSKLYNMEKSLWHKLLVKYCQSAQCIKRQSRQNTDKWLLVFLFFGNTKVTSHKSTSCLQQEKNTQLTTSFSYQNRRRSQTDSYQALKRKNVYSGYCSWRKREISSKHSKQVSRRRSVAVWTETFKLKVQNREIYHISSTRHIFFIMLLSCRIKQFSPVCAAC